MTGDLSFPGNRLVGPLAALCILTAAAPARGEIDLDHQDTLYMVAVSHLDTQWFWTVQTTIERFIPRTFAEVFDAFDRFPNFVFGWEGTIRYKFLREYYPDLWARLLVYVNDGRWFPAGSSVDAGDVNVPSTESLVRHILYGNQFFRREFGIESKDIFLPDCFGFSWALPSVAAHCGLLGFSTQKLGWGSAAGIPFDIGVWEGPDGNSIVAALDAGSYITTIDDDLSHDEKWRDRIAAQYEVSGVRAGYGYYGVGDQGGAPDDDSLAWLEQSIAGDGPLKVLSATPDQLFRDLTPAQRDSLPRYSGELLLTQHATATYTSQAAMKRWNRQNELLADNAERASVAAHWLGAADYPHEKLYDAWVRFLWHQMHDDLTGTSIPQAYIFSWNDLLIALNQFAATLTTAVGGVARALDTSVIGVPLVVMNPLAFERRDLTTATVRFENSETPDHVRVHGPDGAEVPSQITARHDDALEVLFKAHMPSLGFSVYDVRSADSPYAGARDLSATDDFILENERYLVEINADGDIARVFDKQHDQELLAEPMRFELFDANALFWPAWELLFVDIMAPPRKMTSEAQLRVLESGPARAAIEVRRSLSAVGGEAELVQRISLGTGEAGRRLEVATEIDWNFMNTTMKVAFPLAVANPKATYDIGLGTIERGNNTANLYEVPAQQWANLTAVDESYGVSLMSDCKYGWDKPHDNVMRLTLLHTPLAGRYHQDTMDIGRHTFTYALFGHEGDYRNGAVAQAARLNQPPLAFQTRPDTGPLGAELSLVEVSAPEVALRALKLAQESDLVIVRLQETSGRPVNDVTLTFGSGIDSALSLSGVEKELGPAEVVDGALTFDMAPYELRTFGLTPRRFDHPLSTATSRPLELPFNVDVMSRNEDRGDGDFGGQGRTLAGELVPRVLVDDGVRFELGASDPGELNAVACRGQQIPLDPRPGERLYLLMAAVGDTTAVFEIDDQAHGLTIQDFREPIGQWDNRVIDGHVIHEIEDLQPAYYKTDPIAWVGTHHHTPERDEPYLFTYMFKYILPVPEGARALHLPDEPGIHLFAATLAADANAETLAATRLHDGAEPLAALAAPLFDTPADPQSPPREAATSGGCASGELHRRSSWSLAPLILLLLAGLLALRAKRTATLAVAFISLTLLSGCGDSPSDPLEPPAHPWEERPPFCAVDESEIEALYDNMTLRQRIGQHVIADLPRAGSRLTDAARARLEEFALGGTFLAPVRMIATDDPEATMAFIHDAQTKAVEVTGVPMFVALDQEGGVYAAIDRLTGGSDSLSPMQMGVTRDPQVVYEQFLMMGRETRAMGLNMNLAPLIDTHTAIDNGNLNTRCFGPDPEINARLGVAAVGGLQQNLVLSVVKHFPGDGMTAENTHHVKLRNEATRQELEENLLGPFRRAFDFGAHGVMTIPAAYSAFDPNRSAITSRAVTTDFLRDELGFDGLVVTDDLHMEGVQIGIETDEIAAVEALKAGADLLLYVTVENSELELLYERIEAELAADRYPEDQFAASTKRILRYKQKYCLLQEPHRPTPDQWEDLLTELARPEDYDRTVAQAQRAAIMLAAGDELPLLDKRILCIAPNRILDDAAAGWSWLLTKTFCDALADLQPDGLESVLFFEPPDVTQIFNRVQHFVTQSDVLVMATFHSYFSLEQQALLDTLAESFDLPLVHVSLGVPFDHLRSPANVTTMLALMGVVPATLEAGAQILLGMQEAEGSVAALPQEMHGF